MKIRRLLSVLCSLSGAFAHQAFAQQAPFGRPDIPVSNADRVYAADQTSNTVSVIASVQQPIAWRDQTRQSGAWLSEFPALQGPTPGACLVSRPDSKDTCCRIHSLEFCNAD